MRKKFGAFIRAERERKDIGLRQMATLVGVSPTYMSKIERDEYPPPAEDKVKAIAKIIECDADELLARAGRVSSDLSDIIMRHPVEIAALMRSTDELGADVIPTVSAVLSRVSEETNKALSEAQSLPPLKIKQVWVRRLWKAAKESMEAESKARGRNAAHTDREVTTIRSIRQGTGVEQDT